MNLKFYHFSIDGSKSNQYGIYVNDSKYPNAVIKLVEIDHSTPLLCLFALTDIPRHAELRYDYGPVLDAWWRKRVSCNMFALLSILHYYMSTKNINITVAD